MQTHNSKLPDELKELKEAEFYTHGFLPTVAAYCRTLGLKELVNTITQSQMKLQPGLVVQAMVLDVLSGRSPLYHLESFLAEQDSELLLGESVDAHDFNDTNLARSLDSLFNAGTAKIITELGIRAASLFELDLSITRYDTTSTSVWGEYRGSESDQEGPKIVLGHSKDHQPMLKQFMTELLCVDRGVPIFGKTLDGNSSDKTSNHDMLTRISGIMAKHGLGPGAFVYVADSALMTEKNLKAMGSTRFISRLPANFGACNESIKEAVEANEWIDLYTLNQLPNINSRPAAEYKAHETSVIIDGKEYRAIVFHSSSYDKRRQKKLDKQIKSSLDMINKKLNHIPIKYKNESDAKVAAINISAIATSLHNVIPSITPVEVRKPGRPPKNKPPATTVRYNLSWTITENRKEIERVREIAGCFVIITNIPETGPDSLNSEEVLRTYKGQYSIESDFAFLKDPLVVNDLFIKTPSRIDALGMILIIALMIYRLMERTMRLYLQENNSKVLGWDKKPTDKPTAYMLSRVLIGIQVIYFKKSRSFLKEPDERQVEFLSALGLDTTVFTNHKAECMRVNYYKTHKYG
jgi:transposase